MTQNIDEQCQELAEKPASGVENLEASPIRLAIQSPQTADSVDAGDSGLHLEVDAQRVMIQTGASRSDNRLGTADSELNSLEFDTFVIGCRVSINEAEDALVLIRKKQTDAYCDLTAEASFDGKPEFVQFVFNKDEANRIIRFLSGFDGVVVGCLPLDSIQVIAEISTVALNLLNSAPGFWEISDRKDVENLLNFEIEGVYDATVRSSQTKTADDRLFTEFERLISVTPRTKLDAVSTATLFAEGSKSHRIFDVLKHEIPQSELEITVNGTTVARPVLTDGNGHLLAGLADCLRADERDLYVSSYPVLEEFDDDRQAFCLISEARSVCKLSKEAIEACMAIMYEDLTPRTGKRAKGGEEKEILNLSEHWSKFSGCSIHKAQREFTDSREIQGISQGKTPESASYEDAQAIEDAVHRIANHIEAEMQKFAHKSDYLQNRLRSRLKLRVTKVCKALKSTSKSSRRSK